MDYVIYAADLCESENDTKREEDDIPSTRRSHHDDDASICEFCSMLREI
jgi:hypothetical protein